jgi:hypothetical protein
MRHRSLFPLILRNCASGVSKDEADIGASWFETARSRFLTMRVFAQRVRRLTLDPQRSSRASRLEVSQRLPPIFSTSE